MFWRVLEILGCILVTSAAVGLALAVVIYLVVR